MSCKTWKNAKNISFRLHFEPEKESNELNGNAEPREECTAKGKKENEANEWHVKNVRKIIGEFNESYEKKF